MSFRIFISFALAIFGFTTIVAQNPIQENSTTLKDSVGTLDNKYREDQFYFGFTYNLLINKPSGARSNGLTGGLSFGYLRDMPINKRRNIAIAVGLGVSFDEYGNTLFIGEDAEEQSIFTVLDEDDVVFDRNRFSTASLEIPLELRWRSSTAEIYRFWRVYAGVRLSYAYWYKSSFKQSGNNVNQTDIPEFDNIRLGATFAFGYNTVNFYAYYGLNPFFTEAVTTQGDPVDFTTLKLGLLFYFL